jgi:hypothetical protein
MQQSRFKSNPYPLSFTDDQIDVEAGILRGVVMCEVGPAKGHGVELEQQFIDALAAYADKHLNSGLGLKARFGHPAMSDSTMGSQMGYFKNIRKDGTQLKGDLHLLASADLSPKAPKMREWVLSMAQEATEFIMSSIVFRASGLYQRDPETNEAVELKADEKGDVMTQFDDQPVFVDFNEEKGATLQYTDLVEAGAATNSLFSAEMNPKMYAVRAIEFVRENEDILAYLQKHPETLNKFASELGIAAAPKKANLFQQFKEMFQDADEQQDTTADNLQNELSTAQATIKDLETQLATATAAQETAEASLVTQKGLYATEAAQWADGTRELKENPLVEPAAFEETPPSPGGNADILLCATTKKAIK